MTELQAWLRAQFAEKKVEPNSGLGEAITYLLKHWEPLTLFLRKAGAPLDNNAAYAARGISGVVIDLVAPVAKITRQGIVLVKEVAEGAAEGTLGQELRL